MIFITVGTQLAFPRLMDIMDSWAGANPGVEVFAQTGPGAVGLSHMRAADFLPPAQADEYFRRAELIVSHAGMGSILTALQYRKPIIIFPRKAEFGEHRNDHQMATAKRMEARAGVNVAWDEPALRALLDSRGQGGDVGDIPEFASPELISRLRDFLLGRS